MGEIVNAGNFSRMFVSALWWADSLQMGHEMREGFDLLPIVSLDNTWSMKCTITRGQDGISRHVDWPRAVGCRKRHLRRVAWMQMMELFKRVVEGISTSDTSCS
jgi:hypothetical protein